MIRVQRTWARGASAMAVPECPELAASGASMARPRMTLMPNSTNRGSWTTEVSVCNVTCPTLTVRSGPSTGPSRTLHVHGFPHAGAAKQ